MKISVITPVYNVEEYIVECIESVAHQTYKNFEMILVDDGSTDNSGVICEQYSQLYPKKIKTIYAKNVGPLQARLMGAKESTGDVLVFLDSDDCLREDALEQIASCFYENNCDLVMFNAEPCVKFPSLQIKHNCVDRQIFQKESKKLLYEKVIRGEIPNSVCLKAVRTKCTYYPEYFMRYSMKHGEDLLMSSCFITNSDKIVYLDEGLYHYRNRPGSATHSFDSKRKESIKMVHIELEKFVEQWNLYELKPIHNARKVRGWIENLKLLTYHRKQLKKDEFKDELTSMANDPYFRNAYQNMDKSLLSRYDRILAWHLYAKNYVFIILLNFMKEIVKAR